MPRDMSESGSSLDDLISAARPMDPIADAAARERSAQQGLQILSGAVRDVDAADTETATRIVVALLDDARLTPIGDALALHRAEATQHIMILRGRRGLAGVVREVQTMAEARATRLDGALDGLLRGLSLRGIRCPLGYVLDDNGVSCATGPVAHYPIVVSRVLRDVATDTSRLAVSWRRGPREWTTRILPRDEALDARRITRLALDGAPVSSATAGDLVRYLQAFEATNLGRIQETDCSSVLGWVGDSLLVGATAYGPAGAAPVVLDPPTGSAEIMRAHHPSGTWDGWCDVVRSVAVHHPLVMLGIYAAAAAPLLARLGEQGFVIDWSDETSGGKTSLLRVAASVWGDPMEVMLTWGAASRVGPVAAAATLRHLPLILDDTKQGDPETIAGCLYDLPSGRERMRGSVDGSLRQPRTWRTIVLSSGEAPITSFSGDGGARARTLCLQGPPLSAAWESDELVHGVSKHHGHLGPRIAQAIVGIASDRLRERYRTERAALTQPEDAPVTARLLGHVAVLSLARRICEHVGCPVPAADPIMLAVQAAQAGSVEADRPLDAWLAVWSWAASRPADFFGRGTDEPPTGWLGRWDTRPDAPLMVRTELLREHLDRWGYDSASVIASWHRRSWLLVDYGKRTRRVRVGQRNDERMYTTALLPDSCRPKQ